MTKESPEEDSPRTVIMPEGDPYIGAVLGDICLMEQIGKGGMGAVYKARHLKLDKPVAVKILKARPGVDPHIIERFIREARLTARIEHENIVQVLNVGSEGETHYIIQQLLDGEPLSRLISLKGRMEWREATEIILGAARGLAEAHRHGVLHRDIKPANIILTRQGGVKLLDFGLAREIADDSGLTLPNVVMGTPEFCSPEQATGNPVDPRSDLYSLGATFFYLVTGRIVFEAKSAVTLVMKHVQDAPQPPSSLVMNLPEGINTVILRLLAKKKEERFQNAEELITALEGLLGLKHGQEVKLSTRIPPSSRPGMPSGKPLHEISPVTSLASPSLMKSSLELRKGGAVYWISEAGSLLVLLASLGVAFMFGARTRLATNALKSGFPERWFKLFSFEAPLTATRMGFLAVAIILFAAGLFLRGSSRCRFSFGGAISWLLALLSATSLGLSSDWERIRNTLFDTSLFLDPGGLAAAALLFLFSGGALLFRARSGDINVRSGRFLQGAAWIPLLLALAAAYGAGLLQPIASKKEIPPIAAYLYALPLLAVLAALGSLVKMPAAGFPTLLIQSASGLALFFFGLLQCTGKPPSMTLLSDALSRIPSEFAGPDALLAATLAATAAAVIHKLSFSLAASR